MKNLNRFIIIICLLIIFVLFSFYSYAQNVSNDLESNIFRLHIIANSDSDFDQSLKLKVRDNIISYLEKICDNCKSKDDYFNIAYENKEILKQISQNTIYENGYEYNVELQFGNFYFPTKQYGNISYPAGYYDGLKIKIGEAKGKNWWCSLFPPLCFTDISSGIIDEESSEVLKNNVSNEGYCIVTSSNDFYKLKFKIVEFFNKERKNK